MQVYQFKVTIEGIEPPIWRRIVVPVEHTLNDLHLMIQAVMGWDNAHLHIFTIGEYEYTDYFDDDQRANEREDHDYTLEEVLGTEVKKFSYIYDLGDNWKHEIIVEGLQPAAQGVLYPVCLDGARACPPEDCGGSGGYYRCLAALKNPQDPENEELFEWVEGYDPEEFILEETNSFLGSWELMTIFDDEEDWDGWAEPQDEEESKVRISEGLRTTIEAQIREGNPPETKEQFERLISEGWAKKEAIALLAQALANEMFQMLKDQREYDHNNYVKLMKEQPGLHE